MTTLRFRIFWEEDDQTYRDIEILGNQTFLDLHNAILKAFEFDGKHPASFYESDDKWSYGRELSSEVMVNKKGAPALSMLKTPISALVSLPDQKFMYVYDPAKVILFLYLHDLIRVYALYAILRRGYTFLPQQERIYAA